MNDAIWERQLPGLAPLATLESGVGAGPASTAGAFLAMGLLPGACAVFVVVGPSLKVLLLAENLDAFIGGDGSSARRISPGVQQYSRAKFSWTSAPAE